MGISIRWKGAAEYHAWVETEHGEIVDVACDAINHRSSLAASISILPPPKSCWEKPDQLIGRVYEEVRYGGREIDIDLPGTDQHSFVPIRVVEIDRARRVILMDDSPDHHAKSRAVAGPWLEKYRRGELRHTPPQGVACQSVECPVY